MPVIGDFESIKAVDGVLTVAMSPPVAIGGWEIEFVVNRRTGGESRYISKYVNSGYNNLSGINITSSGQGLIDVSISSLDTSGLQYGNYAFSVNRLGSGVVTKLSEGFMLVNP
jgi:hypothetical protein